MSPLIREESVQVRRAPRCARCKRRQTERVGAGRDFITIRCRECGKEWSWPWEFYHRYRIL